MTTSGEQPPGGFEPPPLDYPADSGLPPPVYHPSLYPPPYPGQPNPGYAQPYPPYPARNPPGTAGTAAAAPLTSLVGLSCSGLPPAVGLVLGIIAMRETKSTGQAGYGLAVAGVAIGALVVAGMVLYLLLTTVLYASNWQWAP